MPALGADMDEGTLLEWLVKPGDEVRKGEVIAVVDTEKSAIEVESFATGTIERLIVEPGEKVPVGTVLATIADHVAGQAAVQQKPPAEAKPPAGARPAAAEVRPAAGKKPRPAGKRAAAAGRPGAPRRARQARRGTQAEPAHLETGSPLVRHLAEELGVDLERVPGTGHGGAITRADVTLAAAAAVPQPGKPSRPGRRRSASG